MHFSALHPTLLFSCHSQEQTSSGYQDQDIWICVGWNLTRPDLYWSVKKVLRRAWTGKWTGVNIVLGNKTEVSVCLEEVKDWGFLPWNPSLMLSYFFLPSGNIIGLRYGPSSQGSLKMVVLIGHFFLFQNESWCTTFHMKMSFTHKFIQM